VVDDDVSPSIPAQNELAELSVAPHDATAGTTNVAATEVKAPLLPDNP
jgi:hypothetical protein